MNPKIFSHKWHDHSADEIKAFQNQALHQFVKQQLLPNSKFFQQHFAENHLTADDIQSIDDLSKVPFTSKEDLLSTPDEPDKPRSFILIPDKTELVKRPDIIWKAITRGKRYVETQLNEEYRPIFMTSTTGRSTEPVPFVYTKRDIYNLGELGGRLIDLGEGKSEDRILNMFPYAPHLAYWITHYAATHRNVFCLGTGGGKVMGTEGNLRLITKIKPDIIVAMPTFVYHVFQQALFEGKKLENLRLIVLGGEKVAPGTRRKLAEMARQLGCPNVRVMATYGFTEAKMAWAECPFFPGETSSGYHIYPDYGIVEIIDPKTGAVQAEGQPGEIVFTPLDSRGSVVFRYRTGDFIDGGLTYATCPHCGRRMPRLVGNISRSSEIKNLQLQKVKGTIVDFNSIERMLDDIHMLGTWQLEMRKANNDPLDLDELVLHVTLAADVSTEDLTREVYTHFERSSEIRPNRIEVHDEASMRRRQKVGEVMKEEKIVDNRTHSQAAPIPNNQTIETSQN